MCRVARLRRRQWRRLDPHWRRGTAGPQNIQNTVSGAPKHTEYCQRGPQNIQNTASGAPKTYRILSVGPPNTKNTVSGAPKHTEYCQRGPQTHRILILVVHFALNSVLLSEGGILDTVTRVTALIIMSGIFGGGAVTYNTGRRYMYMYCLN